MKSHSLLWVVVKSPARAAFQWILSGALLLSVIASVSATPSGHPYLFPQDQIDELVLGGADWIAIKNRCDSYLNQVIQGQYGNYAGFDEFYAAEDYAWCYLVSKQKGSTADAAKYGAKGVGLAKVLSRHFFGAGYDSEDYLDHYQFLGLGDGHTTSFALPMTPMGGTTVAVMRIPVEEYSVTYGGSGSDHLAFGDSAGYFGPILKVSNPSGGPTNYSAADYKMVWNDPLTNAHSLLSWGTANHPGTGAAYYVTVPSLTSQSPTTAFTRSGNNIVFPSAPAANEAVFVKFLSDQYEQTGNFLGGLNMGQVDHGYTGRTVTTGLSEAYDAFYDLFTPDLKQEFNTVQNARLDWYGKFGLEPDGDLGNYFLASYLRPVFMTGYGTQPENPRAAEWQALALKLAQQTIAGLTNKVPSGYGVQGAQYMAGSYKDVLNCFTLYKSVTGTDLLSPLEWTDNLIPAIIHGTKPDLISFYDGGAWDSLPAAANLNSTLAVEFIQDMPNHKMVPFARQWLKNVGLTPPSGPLSDYTAGGTAFPLSWRGKISGPLYARSDWSQNAVWVSLSAAPYIDAGNGHQNTDQGHFTIQRGADYLIQDGGGYGSFGGIDGGQTIPWHNTIGFDDTGVGGYILGAPNQQEYGDDVHIDKFQDNNDWVYAQADFAGAYISPYYPSNNPVKKAVRSLLFLRSLGLVLVHDQVKVAPVGVKQIFNMNFAQNFGPTLTQSGNLYTTTIGNSKLFMRQVIVPAGATTALKTVTGGALNNLPGGLYATSRNYQVTAGGQTDDTFLHVFQAGPSGMASMVAFSAVTTPDGAAQGIEVMDGTTPRVLLFATRDNPFIPGAVTYAAATTGSHQDVLGDLRPSFPYAVTVTQGATTILSTTLTSSAQGTLVVSYANTAAANVTVAPSNQPAISLSMAVSETVANPGDVLTYTVTYQNSGTVAAQTTVLSDALDASVQVVAGSISNGGVKTGQTINWTLGNVPQGSSGTVTFRETYQSPHANAATATYVDGASNHYTANSNTVSVGMAAPPVPAVPTGLTAAAVSSTTVHLTWTDSSTNTGFQIERRVGTGAFSLLTTTPANATSFDDATASPGTSYGYHVRAVNGSSDSDWTSPVSATTPGATGGGTGGGTTSSSVTLLETAAFPNPAVGKDPTIRAFVGDADELEITIYDAAGTVVHSDRVTGGPTGTASNGKPYYDYVWTGKKASGVYYAVIHGKKDGAVVRGRVKFAVVR